MESELIDRLSSVLFIPHGGGPLPLLGDKAHQNMIDFLKKVTPTLGQPSAILVISAHWEEDKVSITSGKAPLFNMIITAFLMKHTKSNTRCLVTRFLRPKLISIIFKKAK